MGYISVMKIKQTPRFKKWISALKDKQAKARILIRLKRMIEGNPGDVKPVDAGVYEMRIHVGKGYRVYYIALENVIIVLLCGGDKSSQREDIERAKKMAAEARREAWKYKT
jgi:putative addiction module killer protein